MYRYLYIVQSSCLDRFSAQWFDILNLTRDFSSWYTNISAPLELASQRVDMNKTLCTLISESYDEGNMLLVGSLAFTRIMSNRFNPK